jgi:hypothetical protein
MYVDESGNVGKEEIRGDEDDTPWSGKGAVQTDALEGVFEPTLTPLQAQFVSNFLGAVSGGDGSANPEG